MHYIFDSLGLDVSTSNSSSSDENSLFKSFSSDISNETSLFGGSILTSSTETILFWEDTGMWIFPVFELKIVMIYYPFISMWSFSSNICFDT